MLPTQVFLIPTVREDLDTVLAMERSPENCQYIGHWERNQHEEAIVDTNIAHLKIVSENKIIGYV